MARGDDLAVVDRERFAGYDADIVLLPAHERVTDDVAVERSLDDHLAQVLGVLAAQQVLVERPLYRRGLRLLLRHLGGGCGRGSGP